MAHQWRGVIEEYRDRLPVSADTPVVTLLEGGTPLVRSASLSECLRGDVYLKVEGANPTASFKDRGMTLAMSKAVEAGAKAVVCASTGNTSASAAAYAGRAGITCAVLVPKGKVALGKIAQTLAHGARVLEIDGNFDDALAVTRDLAERHPITLVNSVNPFRLEGQKTLAFEVCDALGRAPDLHVVPVGNAGNITAHGMGYDEYVGAGVIGLELGSVIAFAIVALAGPRRVNDETETQSSVRQAGTTPAQLISPHVGLRPTMLLNPAGTRPEPAVSVPSAKLTRLSATAIAEPELDPPDMYSRLKVLSPAP